MELFWKNIAEFFCDKYQLEQVFELLAPCLIGFAFLVLRKIISKKKLCLVLAIVVPLLVIARWADLGMCREDLCIMLALYLLSFVLGFFFNVRKKWHWALVPVFLFLAYFARAVKYAVEIPSFPFGKIEDKPLPKDMIDSAEGIDYEIRILKADAWYHYARMVRLRAVGDSLFGCTLKAVCGIKDEMLDSCEWQILKDVSLDSLKTLIETYEEETLQEMFFDGYVFEVSLFNYRRGVMRSLEIGNASYAWEGELPKAKHLEEVARAFLPPADISAAYRDSVEKCGDLYVEVDTEPEEN